MVSCFALVGMTLFAAVASAQRALARETCPEGLAVCGTTCCPGAPTAFTCRDGTCVPANGVPPTLSSNIVTVSPTQTTEPNTTVSLPMVTESVTTIVSTANSTSWSTTVFPTGHNTSETDASHTHTATASGTDKPTPTGAAGAVLPVVGLIGAAMAAALAL